ncbi:hypothetical protein K0M31_019473 [Melipona bicolor]|uniref:Uncharacterized protein n=1 Tax=Melipona bicolor TaxID=60889 RepID=A0AA40G2C1_9HYME|nr:hypothetical protein K0M31_019473 [Melipona bicolor]
MENQARKKMCFADNESVMGTEVWSEEAGETDGGKEEETEREREGMDKKNEYKERQ